VLFIASRLRPPGDTINSPIGSPRSLTTLDPCTDTKITAGFGLQAAETESDIVDCTTEYAVCRAAERGLGVSGQASLVHRTMPGKRVLPIVAAKFRGDYAEGLGRYPTGLVPANRRKARGLLRAAWLVTAKRLMTKQLSAD
jgi:hypothetical protein